MVTCWRLFIDHKILQLDVFSCWLRRSSYVYSVQTNLQMQDPENQWCGSGMFIPDPTFFHPGSRIRTVSILDPGSASKNLSILTPKKTKKWFLSSKKYDPGCSSWIPDPRSGCWLSLIPDPGSRGQKGTRSRIPIRNTAFFNAPFL